MNTDLYIDSNYGDFVITNDIEKISGKANLLNIVNERIKTTYNDFRLVPNSGADLDRFIGATIDQELIDDMCLSIESSLTYDGLLSSSAIEIIPIRLNESRIYFRVAIKTVEGKIEVSTMYNNGE